jgi:hypothetical protein
MYKVFIRPVLTYASETWTLSKTNERCLGLFEGRVLRCIFGAKHENGIRGLLEKYPTFGREKETGLLGALDT